jgi:outer membrane lipoprotein-sorting protein
MKTKLLFSLLFVFFIFNNCCFSQSITGAQVIQNMKFKFNEIQDYTVNLEANVNMEKLRMPKIKIKMFYKNPDKFHYESKNFALLPKGGINFNPLNYDEEKYTFELKGQENLNGINTYVIEIIKKKLDKKGKDSNKKQSIKDTEPEKSVIWVDAERWVVKKVSSEPNEKRSLTIMFSHTLIDNKYYLPSKIDIDYNIPEIPDMPGDQNDKGDKSPNQKPRMSNSGKGTVSITFNDYVINPGLSDDIFKEENKKK